MVDDELGGAEDLAGADSGGGGLNLKTIIIGAVIILAVAAGAFFAGQAMKGGGDDTPPANGNQGQQQAADGNQGQQPADNKTEDGNKNGDAQTNGASDTPQDPKIAAKNQQGVLILDTFTVNLNDPFGRRYIEVVLNLIIERKDIVPKIKENELLMPKIRHEVFMTISAKSYSDLKSTSGKVTLFEEIQMRVNEILKEHMGIEPVIEVIQTKFLIQ